ncbi:hypothetical protein NQ314_004188 [Rhamnusium bicolor]|uniref:Uncharacterized protein n=1 Tax=Rhamnusium bicolor TaxID=1586634 RepID=A0AAV8ZL67_9CUCU|nr:hypothetical protein NQ314_004188 [Rhamnusium bicolor]
MLKAVFEKFVLQNRDPDNCCTLLNGTIISIENLIFTIDNQCKILARQFLTIADFYKDPCPSSNIGIYSVSTPGPLEIFDVCEISCKNVKIPFENQFIVFPLLHTL